MRIDQAKTRDTFYKKNDFASKQRVSVYSESYKGEYYNIEVNKLIPFKNQSRKVFDKKSLDELASTIKAHGIRQPLTVLASEDNEGKYEIVSGERRWKAAILVGLTKVPCIVLKDRNSAEEIALIENIQRKNLHPLELMQGFQNLLNKGVCKNQQEISDKLGIARTTVVETLGLKNLPESTQRFLLEKKIKSRKLLRHLLTIPEKEHHQIICNESEQKIKPIKEKIIHKEKIHKLVSIYVQSKNIIFKENSFFDITEKQKKEIKSYLLELLEKL